MQPMSVSQPDQQGRDTLPANRTPSYFDGTAALAALDRLATNPQPFVLTASFHNPHAPMVATGLYYDYYKALETNMFLPPNLSGTDMTNSAWTKHGDPDYQDPAKVKEWMVSYYALCEEVDHYVGLLLNKLDEKGIASNTFVIFVSDHGEMLGAHGMREKNVFLEESAHVPLLMRFPGKIKAGTTWRKRWRRSTASPPRWTIWAPPPMTMATAEASVALSRSRITTRISMMRRLSRSGIFAIRMEAAV